MYWGLNSFEWSGRVRCRLPVSKHRLVILLSGSRCHLSRFVQPLTLPQQTAQRLGNIFYSSWCCVQWMSLTVMINYIKLMFSRFSVSLASSVPRKLDNSRSKALFAAIGGLFAGVVVLLDLDSWECPQSRHLAIGQLGHWLCWESSRWLRDRPLDRVKWSNLEQQAPDSIPAGHMLKMAF